METIFANVEELLAFQRDFLAELESRVCMDHMEDSQIGEVFVMNVSLWSRERGGRRGGRGEEGRGMFS